jgi:hypothetical protein
MSVASSLPIKKIYIDSRFKSSDSVSDSNFYVDLPTSITFPENTVCYIDDISIPVSWYTIQTGINNEFWFRLNSTNFVAYIAEGNYSLTTLNDTLVKEMNLDQNLFTAAPNVLNNTIGIKTSSTFPFAILTDAQIKQISPQWEPRSINNILNHTVQKSNTINSPFVSGYINLIPIRNIYMTSSNLGSYNSLNISGGRSVIKKIPVTANFNEMLYYQTVFGADYIDVSRQTLSRLKFGLEDIYGHTIDLNNNHWSFSLVFSRLNE